MRQRAFSLLELLLVISLLALLLVFVYPDLKGNMRRRSLIESANNLRALIAMTQAQAMQDGVKRRIQFPGTPDPLDPNAEKEVDVPLETAQPIVQQQLDPLNNPEIFGHDTEPTDRVMRQGTRCVAVVPWTTEMFCDNSGGSQIAGPDISSQGLTTFVPFTLNTDGTCDKVAFVLTDLAPDVEPQEYDVGHILFLVVDGRTGMTWIQRAWRLEECELMARPEYKGVSPVLRADHTDPAIITEANILMGPRKQP
jgi:prepilin-type N-terminal cleavage/methylation domain-containing protein